MNCGGRVGEAQPTRASSTTNKEDCVRTLNIMDTIPDSEPIRALSGCAVEPLGVLSVVVTALNDVTLAVLELVDEAVFLGDPSGPVAC